MGNGPVMDGHAVSEELMESHQVLKELPKNPMIGDLESIAYLIAKAQVLFFFSFVLCICVYVCLCVCFFVLLVPVFFVLHIYLFSSSVSGSLLLIFRKLQQREAIASFLFQSDCAYIIALLSLFPAAEAKDGYRALSLLATVIKSIILLNCSDILEFVASDGQVFENCCCCLEYDPDLKRKANHRWFIRDRLKFRTVLLIEVISCLDSFPFFILRLFCSLFFVCSFCYVYPLCEFFPTAFHQLTGASIQTLAFLTG